MPGYRLEFADYLNRLVGDTNNEQVAIRTGLSAEYIRKMRGSGLVPSLELVEKIAKAYHGDLNEARIAADYDPIPPQLVEGVTEQVKSAHQIREETAEYSVRTGRLSAEDKEAALRELAERDKEELE